MKISFFSAFLLLTLAPGLTQAQTAAKPKAAASAAAKPKAAVPAKPSAAAPTPPADKVEARAKALTDNMRQALGLTPPQVVKVNQINLTSVRNVETARLRYRTDLRKLNGIVEDIGQSRLAALKDVLSPEQFNRYQRKREEKMGVPNTSAAQGNPVPGLPSNQD
ncbi:hypothetical protein GCM10011375_34360 [Hymenobacter qilianensis]|uniref:Uncharacterized protein n=2 Tax=Hymenobacter qilianensis TaxID=1385715 RepID=A0ACB5PVJ8_9BACT|nr:hypothetical protein [Hymenobacter qilianensis]QNP51315.1 hypothetical protein H9L05_14770 [Hymenobacter qilianensis]GGF76469.1 hypothetical protein GCM10011375_34360 [Hymenobacter qilianensis]